MPATALKKFLDENEVRYVTIQHSKAYTAQDVAASTHISGKEIAKTVMVKLGGKMAMAVVPGSRMVDLEAQRVQPQPGAVRAVARVAQHRMAQPREVDPDLVRSPGFQSHQQQCMIGPGGHLLVVGASRASGSRYPAPDGSIGVAADGSIDGAGLDAHRFLHQSQVAPFHIVLFDHPTQSIQGEDGLGDD